MPPPLPTPPGRVPPQRPSTASGSRLYQQAERQTERIKFGIRDMRRKPRKSQELKEKVEFSIKMETRARTKENQAI